MNWTFVEVGSQVLSAQSQVNFQTNLEMRTDWSQAITTTPTLRSVAEYPGLMPAAVTNV